MRVLVTGSRQWSDREFIWHALDKVAETAVELGDEEMVVVHGACYPKREKGLRMIEGQPNRSADWLAHQWVERWQFRSDHRMEVAEEPHPARWSMCERTCPPTHQNRVYCPYAGLRRNDHMVSLGADIALAFIKGPSRGTRHCADAAEAAGIRVERFEDPS